MPAVRLVLPILCCGPVAAACDADPTSGPDATTDTTSATDTGATHDTTAADTGAPADTTPDTATPPCPFTPCGSTGLEGRWAIDGLCTDVTFTNPLASSVPACAASVFELEASASGDITFAADHTYSYTFEFSGTIHVALDGACVQALGGISCDALWAQISGSGGAGEGACASLAGGGCNCSGDGPKSSDESLGTWSTSGDELTLSEEGADPDTVEICVSGNRAEIRRRLIDEDDGSVETTVISFSRR
jgi:hypothetical protein